MRTRYMLLAAVAVAYVVIASGFDGGHLDVQLLRKLTNPHALRRRRVRVCRCHQMPIAANALSLES